MKLPKEKDLTAEQMEVITARVVGTLLVAGPPGTGKTVVGKYRETLAREEGEPVEFLVFNQVLRHFTGSDSTFLGWVKEYWRKCTRRSPPTIEIHKSEGETFRKYDYEEMSRDCRGRARGLFRTFRDERMVGHWGDMILDEAQDISKHAHRLLCYLQNTVFEKDDDGSKPSIMILADENQPITDDCSDQEDIKQAHGLFEPTDEMIIAAREAGKILKTDVLYLRTNFRNTDPIARFARYFYSGTRTGKPDLPDRQGEKPRMVKTDSKEDAATRIANYAAIHADQEIGVLVLNDWTRRDLVDLLNAEITRRDKGRVLKVQSYSSKKGDPHNDATLLEFDEPGRITVLCFASAKGLEFDAVFLPELQSVSLSAENQDKIRNYLYVMCSRARKELWLMISNPKRDAQIWKLLPDADSGLYVEDVGVADDATAADGDEFGFLD